MKKLVSDINKAADNASVDASACRIWGGYGPFHNAVPIMRLGREESLRLGCSDQQMLVAISTATRLDSVLFCYERFRSSNS